MSETAESHTPHPDFGKDGHEAIEDLNSTDSSHIFLLTLPLSNDILSDIDGRELTFSLCNASKLASFEDSSAKVYDFVNCTAEEPDGTIFISSATESKIAGKIAQRVSVVHYTDPKELEKHSSAITRQNRNSTGVKVTTSSRYFPMQSGTPRRSQSGRATSSKSSRQKSSLSEAVEPLSSAKRKSISKSPSKSHVSEVSHGHSSGVSAISSDHSHGGKSKKSKHKE